MTKRIYTSDQTYFKPDYYQALKFIVPNYILNDEDLEHGKEVDIKDQIINCHIDIANNISSVLNISAIEGTLFSSINTLEGIANYFIKQNELTNITPDLFNVRILNRVGKKLSNFKTEEEFSEYLNTELLPSITLNEPSESFILDSTASDTHIYLINNLSWLYFLNTSGASYSPSSFISNLITEKIYFGKTIYLSDCIKGLNEFVWRNGLTDYYPTVFASSTGKYTNGTQQLDKLNTWTDIIYSNLYADKADTTVYTRFLDFIDSGYKQENKIQNGPFSKLLQTLSFAAYDSDNFITQLESLNSVEECPSEYLPLLADLIGWKLFGSSPDRWRLQLKNAIEVYKRSGTKKGLQFCLNTVFPKESFSVESSITELWESYVPYLIYYAIATESSYFKSFDSWSRDTARTMNVVGYSPSSMDDNIRMVVDRIIYETYIKFKDSFNIPNEQDLFYYRGRNYFIPPFEEYPYYINVELNPKMAEFIQDRLVCFGVSTEFAQQVRDYLNEKNLGPGADVRSFGWLFFTSGYNSPPNLDSVISNLDSTLFDYVSLWSGKSSHFKLVLDSTQFDFKINELYDSTESGNAVALASQVVNEFAPAHAIPLVTLQLNASDSLDYESSSIALARMDKVDYALNNNEVSALLSDGGTTSNSPRTTIRKRTYEELFPKNGYYDRTGFNMPLSWDYSNELSGLPLGFIPSSLSFQQISNYSSIPEVYYYCNDNDSNKSFYGYDVSNTLRSRGLNKPGMVDFYCDRGQLPDIYNAIHSISELRKFYDASNILQSVPASSEYWFNSVLSLANQYTETQGWFPNNLNNYYDFNFGSDLIHLYKIYTNNFNRHQLNEVYHSIGGPNIFSHVFGPIVSNYNFNDFDDTYVNYSFSSENILKSGYEPFTSTGTGTYVDGIDYVNSSILTNIELVIPSAVGESNSISIVNLPKSSKPSYANDYMFENTFIKMYSSNAIPRVRFNLKKYDSNFLIPNHEFKINVNSLVSNYNGLELGGRTLGVWIHTKEEDGKVFSFTKDGNWERHELNQNNQAPVRFIHTYTHPQKSINISEPDSIRRLKCIEVVTRSQKQNPFLLLQDYDFNNFEINFHTYNNRCDKPSRYYYPGLDYTKNFGVLHRLDQEYIIEVFLMPNISNNKFLLLDKVEIVDLTLNKMSKPIILSGCPDIRMDITKYQLQSIFKFWNDIAGKNSYHGLASRDAFITSGTLGTGGGSRLDYRVDSSWGQETKTNGLVTTLRINI